MKNRTRSTWKDRALRAVLGGIPIWASAIMMVQPATAQIGGTTESGVTWSVVDEDVSLDNGSYIAAPQSSGPGVWIINTKTGKAKFCGPQGGNGNYQIVCIEEEK